LADEAHGPLGFRPHLTLEGPLDSAVPESVRPAVLAVLREALSNVARHARAGAVEVSVRMDDGRLVLTVTDDGVGIGFGIGIGAVADDGEDDGGAVDGAAGRATGGLLNMRRRAEELGGAFMIGPARPRGTVLTWSTPV
jgi:signal transduction histidine kinase